MVTKELLQMSIIFQNDLKYPVTFVNEEYIFYNFTSTMRHFNLTIEQLIFILKEIYTSNCVVIFQASILFNINDNVISTNIELHKNEFKN